MTAYFSASQVADFVYCQRSFYLKRKLGIKNLDSPEIQNGLSYHQSHAWQISAYKILKKLVLILILVLFFLIILLLLGKLGR